MVERTGERQGLLCVGKGGWFVTGVERVGHASECGDDLAVSGRSLDHIGSMPLRTIIYLYPTERLRDDLARPPSRPWL